MRLRRLPRAIAKQISSSHFEHMHHQPGVSAAEKNQSYSTPYSTSGKTQVQQGKPPLTNSDNSTTHVTLPPPDWNSATLQQRNLRGVEAQQHAGPVPAGEVRDIPRARQRVRDLLSGVDAPHFYQADARLLKRGRDQLGGLGLSLRPDDSGQSLLVGQGNHVHLPLSLLLSHLRCRIDERATSRGKNGGVLYVSQKDHITIFPREEQANKLKD